MPKMTSFAHQINGPLRASRETVSHGRYYLTGRPDAWGLASETALPTGQTV
jgi:hypothetical protein